jgi:type IV secretion system protein VirD4
MSSPRRTDGWGPSHQPAGRAPAKRPLWFRLWIAGMLLAWYAYGPTWLGLIAWLGAGLAVAVALEAWLDKGDARRSPTAGISNTLDLVWAVHDESKRHGAGVYLGVDDRGGWTYARAERAVLVLGPPRSGKSSGLIVPAVLSHPGPAVSTSTKPDVFSATVAARSWFGDCWRFDPAGGARSPAAKTLRWSPVTGARGWDGALMIARAMVFGAGVGTGTTEPSHWARRAAALLAPLLHAAALSGRGVDSVVDWVLRHELDDPGRLLGDAGADQACGVLTGLQNTEGRERSSIFSAAADALDAYTSQAALAAASDPNFDADRFVRSTDTIYVHAGAEQQALAAPLVCGLLSEIRAATYRAHHRQRLRNRVLFALDEAANIAPVPELPAIASEGGGQGLVLLCVLQDLSQARARWGAAADGFLTLFGSKLILPGIADSRTLEALSLAIGEYDRQVVSDTRSRQPGSLVPHTSRTYSTQRQRVLAPGDIANIPAAHALYLDGLAWRLLTLTPAHRCEPWHRLTRMPHPTVGIEASDEQPARSAAR